jgi:hypothetical protein
VEHLRVLRAPIGIDGAEARVLPRRVESLGEIRSETKTSRCSKVTVTPSRAASRRASTTAASAKSKAVTS